jgi:heterogeneous nuclear ribonucleoprotein U
MSKIIPPLRKWEPGAPSLYILVGLPGSGKSTWVKKHLQTSATPTHVASTDDVLERIALENGITYGEAHRTRFKDADREFKAEMAIAAQQGRDIIVDRTNVFQSARRKAMALIESNSKHVYVRNAIIFTVPDDELKRRLDGRFADTGKFISWDVVEGMRKEYVEPTFEEFHFIRNA